MSSRANPKVVVLMGGPSAEREVSLSTGRECAAALRAAECEVIEVDAGPDLAARLLEIKPDAVFNALHGRWGEDGAVQGVLEWLRIPYTHSGILASALALDKQRTKDAYRKAGLPVVESVIAKSDDVRRAHVMPPPYVVKPYNEGSSVGIYIVDEAANGPPQLSEDMPDEVMVEASLQTRCFRTCVSRAFFDAAITTALVSVILVKDSIRSFETIFNVNDYGSFIGCLTSILSCSSHST